MGSTVKGTQCSNIVEHFGFTHLSAGDLLRQEIKSGSENGAMIDTVIKEGKIVPSEVTTKLLEEAITKSGNDKFLIDGFPRNEENRTTFESVAKVSPEFVLFFDCSEEEMERRLLSRNQGRSDDNIETIRKRFKVFVESSLPVIEYYESKGMVKKINAAKPISEVFEDVKAIFRPYGPKMKADRLILSNLDHDLGYLHRFPSDFPMSHDLGLSLFTHVGTLVGSSLRQHRQICSSGNLMVQEAFGRLNKFARAFCYWLSRASNPKIFRRLMSLEGPNSRACQSHINQVNSRVQNLAVLQFGCLVREEHAVQQLLANFASRALGRLWNDFQKQHASNVLTLAGAMAIVPPLENISLKMLAESMALGNIKDYVSRPMDQPYLEGKRIKSRSVAVPSTIFQGDAIEPKTGIKFPAFLEDDSSPSTTVLVGMGFKGVKVMRVKNLDLYAFDLQPNTVSEKLGPKYASVPTIQLKDHPDFYDDLLRENLPMRVRLVVHYNGLSIGAVRDVFESSLGLRLQKMNPNTDYRCLKTFGSYFNEDIPIPAGTKIDFCQTSDGQLITEIDGRQIGAVKSKDLCRALFGMYIGDSPVSLDAKKDIAKNVAGLMGKS
uniref:Chalcone--flavanone isomerase n=1 Tax=Leersia perrieri TaxID=77586 RepID=A0A0D9WN14_9ORYZ